MNVITQKLTFEEYLTYNDVTDNRYELVDGELVLMTPPIGQHADIIDFLQDAFKTEIKHLKLDWFVRPGTVGVRTSEVRSRIPDLVVITQEQRQAIRFISAILQTPPILAVEIVSEDNPARDYRYKRSEYATRGIPEYWIVDPIRAKITLLFLEEGLYEETVFTGDQKIISKVFPNLLLSVDQILNC